MIENIGYRPKVGDKLSFERGGRGSIIDTYTVVGAERVGLNYNELRAPDIFAISSIRLMNYPGPGKGVVLIHRSAAYDTHNKIIDCINNVHTHFIAAKALCLSTKDLIYFSASESFDKGYESIKILKEFDGLPIYHSPGSADPMIITDLCGHSIGFLLCKEV